LKFLFFSWSWFLFVFFIMKCLVTGASSGIGKATCQVLSKHGAAVVGTGRNVEALRELKANGDIVDFVVADVTKEGECERIVNDAVAILEGLSTLVNAAGVLEGGAMGDVGLGNYQHNMTANTQAPFELMVHSIPHLKKEKEVNTSIINVSSVNGKQAFAGCVTYCMSKAAIDQLTRCASVDLAPFGIRVNAVNPGVIETNLQKVRSTYISVLCIHLFYFFSSLLVWGIDWGSLE
jgi:NAD(P)-dependent dehydrogenase (short-subunit alcohol dehydrogenase family)